LTLVELLVVLVILAIITTIAVQSTSYLVDQARYETTQRTMQNAQDAIVGPVNQRNPDGTILVSGFVADTGRLPLTIDELLVNKNSLIPFSLYASVPAVSGGTVPAVQSPMGWNGPYVNSGNGQVALNDGWGFPLQINAGQLVSVGADGQIDNPTTPPVGYSKDIVFALPGYYSGAMAFAPSVNSVTYAAPAPAPVPPTLDTIAGVVTGQIQISVVDPTTMATSQQNPKGSDGDLVLHVIAPNPNVANPVAPTQNGSLQEYTFSFNLTAQAAADGTKAVTYQLAGIPVGPRVIWATQGTKSSPYQRVMVRPTAQVINLVMQ
jgi:type II secretory pathway pseudopilin PulG